MVVMTEEITASTNEMVANHEMQVNKIKKHKVAVQSARKQKISV